MKYRIISDPLKLNIILFILVLCISACSREELNQDIVAADLSKFTSEFIEQLCFGDVEQCYDYLSPIYHNDDYKIYLEKFKGKLKDKDLIESRLMSYQRRTVYFDSTQTNYQIAYEYEYTGNAFYLFSFHIHKIGGNFHIKSFDVLESDKSLSTVNRFSLANKNPIYYIWLTFTLLVPIFILITLYFVIRTRIRKKWLWVLFVLIGFGSFSLNWNTGNYQISLLSMKFLGAGFFKSGMLSQWIITYSIPVGAIVFWIRRSRSIVGSENIISNEDEAI